ncbi:hypothetical protein scyTo_0022799, partial [Scyliorhinus torazame]|nr:hypothetical protein [Scyliorhinus torazame]
SKAIVDGNLKLILGLIWTLILHYSISMPIWDEEDDEAKKQTPKQRLLGWIQNKLPEMPITNFSKDWRSGKALGALAKVTANNDRNRTYSVYYTPKVVGLHKVTVLFAGQNISKSPFEVTIGKAQGDSSKVTAQGPGLEPLGNAANKSTYFDIYTAEGHDVAHIGEEGEGIQSLV